MTTKVAVGKTESKGAAAKAEPGEFSEKPAAMVPASSGSMQREQQIRKMADAGGEAVAKYAREAGTQADAPTVIAHDELDNLIGVAFTVLEKTVRQGDFGPYISLVCLITATDDLVIVNAGGTALEGGGYSGIMGDLELIAITPDRPHHVPSGLRKSEYVNRHTNTPSVTYYLDYSDDKASLFARIKSKTKKPRAGANGTQKA